MPQSNLNLKNIKDQVIVITGASSGIGLATAKMAARKGAKVVLASRNTDDLNEIAQQIRDLGGDAWPVTVDVSKFEEVQKLRDQALEKFGRIDTWVNNAGVSIYGRTMDIPLADARQLFETNFWGVHYGCKVAVECMARSQGGMIINLGSEVSERSIALQNFYSASKHAVKGYTEGLRSELEKQGLPIGLTLVRPAGIDTPYTQHAANYLQEGEPSIPAPAYHPDVVANAILECAQTAKRDVFVGGTSKFFSTLEHFAPRLVDYIIELGMIKPQMRGTRIPHDKQNEGLLRAPSKEGHLRGGYKGHVARSSLWTTMSLHPFASFLALSGVGIAVYGSLGTSKSRDRLFQAFQRAGFTPSQMKSTFAQALH